MSVRSGHTKENWSTARAIFDQMIRELEEGDHEGYA